MVDLASRMTRCPRPHDPELGAAAVPDGVSGPAGTLVAGAAGCSPYLAGLIGREGEWLKRAVTDPEAAFDEILAGLGRLELSEMAQGFRQAKRRAALLLALADLGGVWSLEEVTGRLTALADAVCDHGLKALVGAEIARGKLPMLTSEDAQTAGGMVLLAMGKMGAGELNYSSDIDLICLFDETRFDPDDYAEVRAAFIRATRKLTALIGDMTEGGYVFRTDLRLRPDAAVTPVCLSMEAAERYYESVGRTWERAAYIKARACAGDIAAGERFLKTLTPFVWRKHLDFAAIRDAHDMRLAIRSHKGLGGPMQLEGHDMKLGRGGIREIEFFTQTQQLISGGREPSLRVRGTCDGLKALAAENWIDDGLCEGLIADYRAHREVEHRLQMINDAQTHKLPKSDASFARLAALMDRDVDEMRADIEARLKEVHSLTEGFFAPNAPDGDAEGFGEEVAERWRTYPALRSTRAVEIFERLKPVIFERLRGAVEPEAALREFDGFLRGLPAGVQLFALFEARPQLMELTLDICAISPRLAAHLSRNSAVLDAVIAGDFFTDWPGTKSLSEELTGVLEAATDYEAALDAARRWTREWHFRVGVHHLRGLIGADEAGGQYADLAQAVVTALMPVVTHEFSRKHGPPPGRGAAVLAMGSLGAGRLHATSDLDLIVIYDGQGQESSEGRRPLNTRSYFARLTQALITALTAPMAQGRLYEVDMRLRPSGRQGPVATSLATFLPYQLEQAWTWEHLALTRARVIAGNPDLEREIEDARRQVLSEKAGGARIPVELAEMRERIAAAKAPSGPFDAKTGQGRLLDIELFAQGLALQAGAILRGVRDQIEAGSAAGLISAAQRAELCEAYEALWALRATVELLGVGDAPGREALQMMQRETGCDSEAALKDRIASLADRAATLISEHLVPKETADD